MHVRRMCHTCLSEVNFIDGGDGFFYCTYCSSQADDIIDTGVDEDDLLDLIEGGSMRFSNHSRIASDSIPESNTRVLSQPDMEAVMSLDDIPDDGDGVGPTEPADFGPPQENLSFSDYYTEIRLRYIRGIEIMIQSQCEALVEKFNVNSSIIQLVGPIWKRFLESTGVMDDEWADNVIHESESQELGEVNGSNSVRKRSKDPRNLLGRRAVIIWRKSLKSIIPLFCSLAISFLVCHLVRSAILPTDILKWILNGELPYFGAFLEIDKQLGPPSAACPFTPRQMFRPMQIISLQKLESFAASIAQRISLEMPPVNFHAIASRYLQELCLPFEAILPQACRIYEWSTPMELYLSDNETHLPTRVFIMSILVVTVRMLYDLNGGTWEMNLSTSNYQNSEANVRQDLKIPHYDAGELVKTLEAEYPKLDYSFVPGYAKNLHSYLKYCEDSIFCGFPGSYEDYEEEKLVDTLWSAYKFKEMDVDLSGSDGKFHTEAETSEFSQAETDSLHGCKTSSGLHEETAIRKLKVNMADNRFCYIPPREEVRKNNGYVYYIRRKKGVYSYAVHADYYILLRSCARIAQVDLRTMHIGVMSLEKRLESLEKEIDHGLTTKLQNDFSDNYQGKDEEEPAEKLDRL